MQSIQKIVDTIESYYRLLKIIEEHSDEKMVCKLTKKEITALYGLSYTGTCKKLNYLLKYGLLKSVNEGLLRTEKKVYQDTPLSLLPKIILLMLEKPEMYGSFKLQAEQLSVSMDNLQVAWGFYSNFFGSKLPQEDELEHFKRIATD